MNFWQSLENQSITKDQLQPTLFKKLGKPSTDLQTNLCQEILKKIVSYFYSEAETQNYTTYSLIGSVFEIADRTHKTGKNKGQTYYVLKLGGQAKETLQARKEDLPEDKWKQIQKLAILGKNLVFKYKKWITNKQILDFYPQSKK